MNIIQRRLKTLSAIRTVPDYKGEMIKVPEESHVVRKLLYAEKRKALLADAPVALEQVEELDEYASPGEDEPQPAEYGSEAWQHHMNQRRKRV